MHSIYIVLLAALAAALLGFSNLHANGFPTRPAISTQLQAFASRVPTQLAAMILQGDPGAVWRRRIGSHQPDNDRINPRQGKVYKAEGQADPAIQKKSHQRPYDQPAHQQRCPQKLVLEVLLYGQKFCFDLISPDSNPLATAVMFSRPC